VDLNDMTLALMSNKLN